MQHPQLTLPLGIVPSSSFASFVSGKANANACAVLQALCSGELHETQLFLWGERSVGKTHLLSAACQDFASRGYQVAYLTGDLANYDDALLGMEAVDLFCLDDLHLLQSGAEENLFHCINRCRDSQTRLVFASRHSFDELDFGLADLMTRLSWGPVFQLQALEDDDLSIAFALMLNLRGLDVSGEVIEYVSRRYPREITALKQLVERLDQASLSEQRRITIPLVKSINESMA